MSAANYCRNVHHVLTKNNLNVRLSHWRDINSLSLHLFQSGMCLHVCIAFKPEWRFDFCSFFSRPHLNFLVWPQSGALIKCIELLQGLKYIRVLVERWEYMFACVFHDFSVYQLLVDKTLSTFLFYHESTLAVIQGPSCRQLLTALKELVCQRH